MKNQEKIAPEEVNFDDAQNVTFRSIFEKFMLQSDAGRYFENSVTLLSFFGFFMYVFWTYYPDEFGPWFYSDYGVGSIYLIEWLIRFYISQHRIKWLLNDPAGVDLLTALPLFMGTPDADIVSIARILRMIRVSRMANRFLHWGESSEVQRQIFTIGLTIGTIILISAGAVQVLENQDPDLLEDYDFFYMLYFVIVTVATVGYGTPSPTTDLGRACVIILIIIVLILVPKQTNELVSLMGMQSVYARNSYKSTDVNHIIVTGSVQVQALTNFCEELFHPDHGTADRNSIILQQQEPSPEMEMFLRNPKFELFLTYLQGNAMIPRDLKRASVEDSKACVLLTNKYADDPYEVDHKNIMTGLSIKKFAYNATGENLRLCMQLIKPDSKMHYYSSLPIQSNDQLIIVEEIKMAMLAKSCFCTGLISMMSNIAKSSGEPPTEGKVKWLYEYQMGMGHEIYRAELSIKFMGKTFSEVANIIYNECDAMIFGLELDVAGKTIIRLNPGKYVIPDTVENNINAYVICEDDKMADRIATWEMSPEEIAKRQAQIVAGANEKKFYEESSGSDDDDEDLEETDIKQDYYFSDNKSFEGIMATSLQDSSEVQNHIVVCGLHPSLYYFLLPLRARYLKSIQWIVLLNPEYPDQELMESILKFPKIRFIKGSPLFSEDLLRTNLEFADKAVIFRQEKENDDQQEEMLDAETVFIYKAIEKVNKKVQVMTELVYSSNIEFLQGQEEFSGAYELTPLYAAGEVYISSIIDTLTAQTYYNKHIITILQQLLTSGEETSMAIRALCKNLELDQSNLWQIQVPEDFVNHTFGELFNYLVSEYNVLPLGMYRFPGSKDNTRPYVYTNPSRDTRITHNDKIFLLAHEMPDRLITGDNIMEAKISPPESASSSVMEKDNKDIDVDQSHDMNNLNIHQAYKSQATVMAMENIHTQIRNLQYEINTVNEKVGEQEVMIVEKVQQALRLELSTLTK